MKHVIDANNKKVGRVASQAAHFLMGKDSKDYKRNVVAQTSVEIINASKALITDKKMQELAYTIYSGYPGGLRSESLKQVADKRGYAEIFRRAVYGMLPTNTLRSRMIKNLTITE